MSISTFYSSQREPAQVSYIGICRGSLRAGKRMAELVKGRRSSSVKTYRPQMTRTP
jgi:hypothetical protein